MKLEGKRVIVTGGAMGIGLATVKRLLKEGCSVTIWDINESAMNDVADELNEFGERLYFNLCDVSDRQRVYELAAKAEQDMGGIDILINNAGYVKGGDLPDQPDEIWENTININLTSLIYTTKAVLPQMYQRNSGYVVNISSASSTLGVPGLAVYTATKWAVWGLTESIRFEAINKGKKGVKFSSIHPGYIRTGMFEGAELGFPGNLIVPTIKSHDVIAKAIVEDALKKEKYSVKRPRTLKIALILRGILPDKLYQKILILVGVNKSMTGWKGREKDK